MNQADVRAADLGREERLQVLGHAKSAMQHAKAGPTHAGYDHEYALPLILGRMKRMRSRRLMTPTGFSCSSRT